MDKTDSLLRAVLATVSRQVFPPDALAKLLITGTGGKKQLAAYNLCNGETPQAEIGKRVGLDKGSLSRSMARWVELGILFRVGANQLPLHIYPLPNDVKIKSK